MSKQKFRKGQSVSFQYGSRWVQGIVKEDRGPIGMKGRVLYLIEFSRDPESQYTSHIELPADELAESEGTNILGKNTR